MPRRRKRRAPGSGYTTQAANGTWSAFFPKSVGGGYHVRKGFDTRAHAEIWLDSLLKQRADKLDVKSGQMKVGVWMDTWVERAGRERDWKAKMKADVAWKLGYVKPYLEAYALADVFPDHVDSMLDELQKSLSENTIRQIRNYLYQVFESAVKRRYITFNPVIKPERRKRAKQKPPQRLTASQAAILLTKAADSFYALAFWLIICLGLRAGEVCGLRRVDIDLKNAILSIEQEYTDLRGVAHQDSPKGDKTRRVPFPRALIPLLELHLRAVTIRATRGMRAGTWVDHGLVFPGKSGKPLNTNSLRHTLHALTDACNLPPVTTHNLRHTAGGLLTAAETPQPIVGAILGHTPNITGHYAPPDIETMRPWIEKVYQAITGEVERIRKSA